MVSNDQVRKSGQCSTGQCVNHRNNIVGCLFRTGEFSFSPQSCLLCSAMMLGSCTQGPKFPLFTLIIHTRHNTHTQVKHVHLHKYVCTHSGSGMTFGCPPTASVHLLSGNCRSPCLPCFHGTAQLLWARFLPPRHAGLRAAVQEPAVLSDGTVPVSPAMPGSWNCNLPCLQCIVIADTGCAVTCNFILSCSPAYSLA